MEPWKLHHHARPYLAVDEVSVDEAVGSVAVTAYGETYDVQSPDVSATQIASWLEQLKSPESMLWQGIARPGAADGPEPLRDLLGTLDTLGLVADRDSGSAELVRQETGALLHAVDELASWLLSPAAPWDQAAVLASARSLLAAGGRPLGARHPLDLGDGANFPLSTLTLQRRYWQASAPLTGCTVDLLLARLTGGDQAVLRQETEARTAGAEEPGDGVAAVHGAASLLALSALPHPERLYTPSPEGLGTISGINLALEAERTGRDAMDTIGAPPYVEALESGNFPDLFLHGAFMEEYYITRRFVEMITPVLSRRFRHSLRKRLFQYYNEEFGHEVYERATCLSLGISEEKLDAHIPLPYHQAYVDVFTAISQSDPVAYLASIMVTEGLPGDPFGINDHIDADRFGEKFAAVFREHEEANTALSHDTLTRHLLADIPSVSPEQHFRTLNCVSYLTELTHRAWTLLYDLHSDGPGAAALPPLFAEQR